MQAPDHINTGILASPAPAGPQPHVLDPRKMFPTDPLPPASVRPVSAGDIPRRISLEKSGQTMNTRKSTCVLLVEDHVDTQVLMTRLLARSGYTVHTASGYREALAVFEHTGCNILICDIRLPDGCGLELMRQLKPLGVVGAAVSGLTTREDRAASLDAGFATHLCKPIQFDRLLAEIQAIASGEAA